MIRVDLRLGPQAMRLLSQFVQEIEVIRKIPSYTYGIIVVAVEGHAEDWAAYFAEAEKGAAYCEQHGDKLSASTAAVLFPWLAERFRYRS